MDENMAGRIADALMIMGGSEKKADRLVLVDDTKKEGETGWNLGGHCRSSVITTIIQAAVES